MPSSPIQAGTYAGSAELALAVVAHPPLEQALSVACTELGVREAYLAALRDPALGPQPRLLLAVSGTDARVRQCLASRVAVLLPEDLALDLIELADDSLSEAVRQRCTAFFRT
ncbi:MAG: enhanced serine sensitivity protein SseB C-terminal domain-containing protein [Pseudomonadota bacterium]